MKVDNEDMDVLFYNWGRESKRDDWAPVLWTDKFF